MRGGVMFPVMKIRRQKWKQGSVCSRRSETNEIEKVGQTALETQRWRKYRGGGAVCGSIST